MEAIVHVEVSLSKALNPQLLPGITAAHCSLITTDGSMQRTIYTQGEIKVYISFSFFLLIMVH